VGPFRTTAIGAMGQINNTFIAAKVKRLVVTKRQFGSSLCGVHSVGACADDTLTLLAFHLNCRRLLEENMQSGLHAASLQVLER